MSQVRVLSSRLYCVKTQITMGSAEDVLERVKLKYKLPDYTMFLIYRSSLLPKPKLCACGGMADAGDLKSPVLRTCGFESHHAHLYVLVAKVVAVSKAVKIYGLRHRRCP